MIDIDELFEFLQDLKVNPKRASVGEELFQRVITFKVYDIHYKIIWYNNHSTLRIGLTERAACIPFKYVYLDDCYPLVGGNRSIGFSYVKNEKKFMFDREYPYEIFRIPLELS